MSTEFNRWTSILNWIQQIVCHLSANTNLIILFFIWQNYTKSCFEPLILTKYLLPGSSGPCNLFVISVGSKYYELIDESWLLVILAYSTHYFCQKIVSVACYFEFSPSKAKSQEALVTFLRWRKWAILPVGVPKKGWFYSWLQALTSFSQQHGYGKHRVWLS